MKTCTKCFSEKPISEFHKNRSKKDGLNSSCKSCVSARHADWYSRNKETKLEKNAKWHKENPWYREENAESIKSTYLSWYSRNREGILQNQRERYEKNQEIRERNLEDSRRYARLNPLANRAYKAKRRAKISSAGGSFTANDIQKMHELQKGKCIYCKTKIHLGVRSSYHVDHVVPIAKGGSNSVLNLQLLCPTCNRKKSDIDPILFASRLGFLL